MVFRCGIDLKLMANNGEYFNVFTGCLYLYLFFGEMFKSYIHFSVGLFVDVAKFPVFIYCKYSPLIYMDSKYFLLF